MCPHAAVPILALQVRRGKWAVVHPSVKVVNDDHLVSGGRLSVDSTALRL